MQKQLRPTGRKPFDFEQQILPGLTTESGKDELETSSVVKHPTGSNPVDGLPLRK
jgi:hypothetical protein